MSHLKYVFLILFVSVFLGCKSTKSLMATGTIEEGMTAKKIIKENLKQEADFKTLQAKVKIDYSEGDKQNSVTVNLRMEKDKVIWLSAPLAVARVMITPDKVQFYNKLENEYFDGDYSLLSDLLGITLDFDKVQNLLMGETIFSLKNENFNVTNNEISYILKPETQSALYEIFYLVNPGHFKLDSQQLSQPTKKRFLEIEYKNYQLVNKEIFPEVMTIMALEMSDEVKIELQFRSISINEDLRFPFEIPSGYKAIELK